MLLKLRVGTISIVATDNFPIHIVLRVVSIDLSTKFVAHYKKGRFLQVQAGAQNLDPFVEDETRLSPLKDGTTYYFN